MPDRAQISAEASLPGPAESRLADQVAQVELLAEVVDMLAAGPEVLLFVQARHMMDTPMLEDTVVEEAARDTARSAQAERQCWTERWCRQDRAGEEPGRSHMLTVVRR